MVRTKLKCRYCGKEISINNLSRHEKACFLGKKKHHNDFSDKMQSLPDGLFKCLICGKIFKKNGINTHIWRTHTEEGSKFNHRIKILQSDSERWKRSNGAIKAKELGKTWQVSEETRIKLSNASKKQVWDEQRRLNHSRAMKQAVKNHPESYNSKNRGRVKQFQKYGVIFQGKWELYFYDYCISKNISILRNDKAFDYVWNGERKYFPDFYLPELDYYVEVKGYKTERDQYKWQQFEEKLIIIDRPQIDIILSGKDINLIDCIYQKY